VAKANDSNTGQWLDRLALAGTDGGCSGTEIDHEAECEKIVQETEQEQETEVLDLNSIVVAKEWLWKFRLAASSLPCWRAWCKGSIPNELLRILLRPRWVWRREQKLGLGASDDLKKISMPYFNRWLLKLFLQIVRTNTVPMDWHKARGAKIGKGNGLEGIKGERLVVLLCVFGRNFYKMLMNLDTSAQTYPSWVYGCLPHRRREIAMLVQRAVSYRLSLAKWYHLTKFYDATNAFWSIKHQVVADATWVPFVPSQEVHHLIKQRVQYATISFEDAPTGRDILVGEGVMPGDHTGPRLFNAGFVPAVHRSMQEYCNRSDTAKLLQGVCPVTGGTSQVGHTVFVDDQAAKVIGKSGPALLEEAQLLDEVMVNKMQEIGIALNQAKLENVVEGPSNLTVTAVARSHRLAGRTTANARYLGGRHTQGLTFRAERDERLLAGRRGWAVLLRFWTSSTPIRVRLIAFGCMVVGSCLAGLEACAGPRGPLTASDLKPLDTLILRYLRVLLRGRACRKQESTNLCGEKAIKYTNQENNAVWARCGLVPCFLELRVRRLGMLQKIAAHPEDHVQFFAAVFGAVGFEANFETQLQPDGTLGCKPTPWAQQINDDLEGLAVFDDGLSFLELCRTENGKLDLREPFAGAREEFCQLDVHGLKAAYTSVHVPPPGLSHHTEQSPTHSHDGHHTEQSRTHSHGEDVEDQFPHVCNLLNAEGHRCQHRFQTFRAMATHRRFGTGHGGEHGERYLVNSLIVNNQCPICKSTFLRRSGAMHHLRAALSGGKCFVDRSSANAAPPIDQQTIECQLCGDVQNTVTEFQNHCCSRHLAISQEHYFVFPSPTELDGLAGQATTARREQERQSEVGDNAAGRRPARQATKRELLRGDPRIGPADIRKHGASSSRARSEPARQRGKGRGKNNHGRQDLSVRAQVHGPAGEPASRARSNLDRPSPHEGQLPAGDLVSRLWQRLCLRSERESQARLGPATLVCLRGLSGRLDQGSSDRPGPAGQAHGSRGPEPCASEPEPVGSRVLDPQLSSVRDVQGQGRGSGQGESVDALEGLSGSFAAGSSTGGEEDSSRGTGGSSSRRG